MPRSNPNDSPETEPRAVARDSGHEPVHRSALTPNPEPAALPPTWEQTESARAMGDAPPAGQSLVGIDLPDVGDRTIRSDIGPLSDLNLDQILGAIVRAQEERDLITTLFYRPLEDGDLVRYRQDVFRDFEDQPLLDGIRHFAQLLRQVRSHLVQMEKMEVELQRQGWYLDAAILYSEAVSSLHETLREAPVVSQGLSGFRTFLLDYVASPQFTALADETKACRAALDRVRYCIRIHGRRVDVSRYDGEADYSVEVMDTFARFKQGAVKDYRVTYRTWPGMTNVGAQVVASVARLFPEEFSALQDFCRRHAAFVDDTVRDFERGLQFYLSYLDYVAPLRAAGLRLCYPEVRRNDKHISATQTFDLALAQKLTKAGMPVVVNDFYLADGERVIVVSGPNQGGKTTFARTVGQLHYLARLGYPVPGIEARLFLCDRLFTHFEREEDLARMRGQLEDDIVRVREILQEATPNSLIIMNESFSSTTLRDGLFLGKKVLAKVVELDLLCVYVTFLDELASYGPSVVSMVSQVVPENPVERTYKVLRAPADGLAYALAIAEKYHLTYDRLRSRLAR